MFIGCAGIVRSASVPDMPQAFSWPESPPPSPPKVRTLLVPGRLCLWQECSALLLAVLQACSGVHSQLQTPEGLGCR